jgi:L-asparaginase II
MVGPCPPLLAVATRDGVVESVHRGTVAVVDADGALLAGLGAAEDEVYVRSAAKPFQALATLAAADAVGLDLPLPAIAIACASHVGSDDHQIEAAHLLALAGADEDALRCPPADPADRAAALGSPVPTRLAHNCSGKHAGFVLAEVAAGRDPAGYLDPDGALQRGIRDDLARTCGAVPAGPGVDGCGAPAWRLPLTALARGFARLAAGTEPALARIRTAMTARPDLVGGGGLPDTELMRADARIVAKRGAEAVFAVGARTEHGVVGVAVKIADGGNRAAGPVAAAVLAGLGLSVPEAVRAPAILGGGAPHGALEPAEALRALAASV